MHASYNHAMALAVQGVSCRSPSHQWEGLLQVGTRPASYVMPCNSIRTFPHEQSSAPWIPRRGACTPQKPLTDDHAAHTCTQQTAHGCTGHVFGRGKHFLFEPHPHTESAAYYMYIVYVCLWSLEGELLTSQVERLPNQSPLSHHHSFPTLGHLHVHVHCTKCICTHAHMHMYMYIYRHMSWWYMNMLHTYSWHKHIHINIHMYMYI